jgi:hypothetical protein
VSQCKKPAIIAASGEVAIEVAKEALSHIPFLGDLIEGVKSYKEKLDEQQRQAFVDALAARVDDLETNREWYATAEGQEFVRKVVATALNSEHADKANLLANALANGPSLVPDQAQRMKFVELIRQLSKPALELLAVAVSNSSSDGVVHTGELAVMLKWAPELADACARELGSAGALSSVRAWYLNGEYYSREEWVDQGGLTVTKLTKAFAAFISAPG